MKPPEPTPTVVVNPFRKVPRSFSMKPPHAQQIAVWVDAVGKFRPFPIPHGGEIVGELVEHAQATNYIPKALRAPKK